MNGSRLVWIDYMKLLACVLVVLGHFFQSMVAAELIPDSGLYRWFIRSIYCFHVPMFFLCSGYLYQKNGRVTSVKDWLKHVLLKLVNLGVPYFTFSILTWLLKTVFSASVNAKVTGLWCSLFINPLSPYWYLYTLFLLFVVTPLFLGKKTAVAAVGIALVLKAISIFAGETEIFPLDTLLENGIWFVLGMWMCATDLQGRVQKKKWTVLLGWGLVGLFLGSSILVFWLRNYFVGKEFLLGLMACGGITLVILSGTETRFLGLSQYTMPVFLMHTIFAAGLRSALLKLGIDNVTVHIVCGLVISFLGPVVTAQIMHYTKWLEIFLYPGKFLK